MKTITYDNRKYTELRKGGNKIFLLDEAVFHIMESVDALKLTNDKAVQKHITALTDIQFTLNTKIKKFYLK